MRGQRVATATTDGIGSVARLISWGCRQSANFRKLVRLNDGEKVVGAARIIEKEER